MSNDIPSKVMVIDPVQVPEQFRHLIPLAEQWGIDDDGYRAEKIRSASKEEINELKSAVQPVADKLYLEWLGDNSWLDSSAKDAYLAFTAMVLAAEES